MHEKSFLLYINRGRDANEKKKEQTEAERKRIVARHCCVRSCAASAWLLRKGIWRKNHFSVLSVREEIFLNCETVALYLHELKLTNLIHLERG